MPTPDRGVTRNVWPTVKRQLERLAKAAWRLRWVLLANLYLMAPLLLYDVILSFWKTGRVDKIGVFAVPASLLWLLVVQAWVRRLWIVHVALLPFYVLVGVELFLIVHYDCRLSSSSISMILGNLGDGMAYVKAMPLAIAGGVLVVFGFFVLCLWRIRHVSWHGSRRAAVAGVAGLVLVYGALIVSRSRHHGGWREGVMDVVAHERSSPFGCFAQGYLAYDIAKRTREHAQRSAAFSYGSRRAQAPAGPELYVMVIGESSRPDHWSLYGYPRATSPRLARQTNLVVFPDVVAQSALTQIAVPLLITRQTVEAPDRHQDDKSILAAFREAGFFTSWLSTQQRDQWSGAINQYSGEADQSRFFERRLDGVLVDSLQHLVAESPAEKIFAVLHTQGSHFTFADRYPRQFERFPTTGPDLSERDEMINSYDNSVAYTDEVLAQVIELCRTRPGPSAVLYVADHGENLRDDERGLFGHFLNNEYDLPIPMLLWYSPEYARRWPERIKALHANAARPLTSRAVFWTMLGLAGITVGTEPAPPMSVLDPELRDVPRLVQHGWGVTIDYDQSVRGRGGAGRRSSAGGGAGPKVGGTAGAGEAGGVSAPAGVPGGKERGAVLEAGRWSTGATARTSAGLDSTRPLMAGPSRGAVPAGPAVAGADTLVPPSSARPPRGPGRVVSNVPATAP
jgi:glucan phosphoethanolaminetransferase (alkaline phosphatase superfamily)